jgi:hypothetical protein
MLLSEEDDPEKTFPLHFLWHTLRDVLRYYFAGQMIWHCTGKKTAAGRCAKLMACSQVINLDVHQAYTLRETDGKISTFIHVASYNTKKT